VSDPGDVPNDGAGVSSRLTAGLQALSTSGFSAAIPDAVASTHDIVPLPPLSNPSAATSRREPTAEGLAVADRILVAAGVGIQPRRISQQSPDAVALDPATTGLPLDAPDTPTEHSGHTTLVPHSAIVTLPTGETFSMNEGETLTIGRVAAEGVIAVNHVEVSRRHVTLEMRFGQVLATDLGSTNGTMHVSGSRSSQLTAQTPAHLLEGDRLQVGADVPLCVIERIDWQA
jgi:hypothetical protein